MYLYNKLNWPYFHTNINVKKYSEKKEIYMRRPFDILNLAPSSLIFFYILHIACGNKIYLW